MKKDNATWLGRGSSRRQGGGRGGGAGADDMVAEEGLRMFRAERSYARFLKKIKKLVEFSTKGLTPPPTPVSGKINK